MQERAEKSLKNFQNTKSFVELNSLGVENGFEIYTRASGKYFIVVVEPLLSREVGIKAFKLAKTEYKGAYLNRYEPAVIEPEEIVEEVSKEELVPKNEKKVVTEEKAVVEEEKKQVIVKDETIKPVEKIEVQEKQISVAPVQEKIESVVETNNTQTPQKVVQEINKPKQSVEKTKEFALDILDILFYLVLLVVFGVIVYYYIKFKRIYDQY